MSTMNANVTAGGGIGARVRSAWTSDSARRFRSNKVAVLCTGWLIVVILAVLIGPYFTQNPNQIDVATRLAGPSLSHLFGTDELGRDILARTLEGGRVTLTVAILATVIPFIIGLVLGSVAGYRSGVIDEALTRLFDIIITFPALIFGIILAVAVGPSEKSEIIAL